MQRLGEVVGVLAGQQRILRVADAVAVGAVAGLADDGFGLARFDVADIAAYLASLAPAK